jgi:hypothetical protein
MHKKYIFILSSTVVAMAVLMVAAVSAGNPDNPPGPPETTNSYTLEDIYDRLATGAAGAQITFTEPSEGPPTGTMHTLNEIMSVAPQVNDTNGATQTHLLAGMTAWGLTSDEWGVITGTYPYAPVPKTGQTISYTVGDDGDLEKGVAWPVPRFTDNDDGTVTDNLTGLVWLRDASCQAFFSGDAMGQNHRDWSAALAADNALASGYCGLSDSSVVGDWRLPNLRELHSLIDYGNSSPALPDGHPFTNVTHGSYWTSSTNTGFTDRAWYVSLPNGMVSYEYKTETRNVWAVRDGHAFAGRWR